MVNISEYVLLPAPTPGAVGLLICGLYKAKDLKVFFTQHYPVFVYPGRQSFVIEWLVLGLGNLGKPLT